VVFEPEQQPAQADGDELDLSALVRASADLPAGNTASPDFSQRGSEVAGRRRSWRASAC